MSVTPDGGSSAPSPAFSVAHMDRTADPHRDFYRYAAGRWIAENPVPSDKARWGAFDELREQNFLRLRTILEEAERPGGTDQRPILRQVGDLYASATDLDRREALGWRPLAEDLARVERSGSLTELLATVALLHDRMIPSLFIAYPDADRKASGVYALYLVQGGLSLPDRDYYLADGFAKVRDDYLAHLARMFALAGDAPERARRHASTVLELETELARPSRSRTELRDAERNYNKRPTADVAKGFASLHLLDYLAARGVEAPADLIVGQPEFFEALDALLAQRPIEEWRTYVRWQLLHAHAPLLHRAADAEDFDFFHRTLMGQREPEPTWRRAALLVDEALGEALGELYVERYFPSDARARMVQLVDDLREVFRDRLAGLPWMTEATRLKALEKFGRFTTKIGHPERFRDYGSVRVERGELVGSYRRALQFESRRTMARIGRPVDRSEWEMTPPTVNAYFNPSLNEIVFPAGILQPPFFDVTKDDAVNYGGIGGVIGHEITHGYDDEGRRYDAEGNLSDWWTEADAREFTDRARTIIEAYGAVEPVPGMRINGELTLGENIADLGGVSLAYEALERRLAREPARRKLIDGLTPEQRFFVAWAQVWRSNCLDPERRRRLTIDPHAPAESRAVLPVTNFAPFYEAFAAGDVGAIRTRPIW